MDGWQLQRRLMGLTFGLVGVALGIVIGFNEAAIGFLVASMATLITAAVGPESWIYRVEDPDDDVQRGLQPSLLYIAGTAVAAVGLGFSMPLGLDRLVFPLLALLYGMLFAHGADVLLQVRQQWDQINHWHRGALLLGLILVAIGLVVMLTNRFELDPYGMLSMFLGVVLLSWVERQF